ncbi:hypothetical protein ABZ858_10835 [Streptomyces sp. NPDC047017]|uniref:hypothetical protein n=1 Tax=Streptomyces sp. NPDC047017 TaxID=3155024 RepID=UPI0033CD79C5
MMMRRRIAVAGAGVMLALGGAVVTAPSASATPQVSCVVDVQGTRVVVTCRGLQANVGYRAKATCLKGNNTGVFVKYGPWKGTGMPDTSEVDCGSKVISGDFQVAS